MFLVFSVFAFWFREGQVVLLIGDDTSCRDSWSLSLSCIMLSWVKFVLWCIPTNQDFFIKFSTIITKESNTRDKNCENLNGIFFFASRKTVKRPPDGHANINSLSDESPTVWDHPPSRVLSAFLLDAMGKQKVSLRKGQEVVTCVCSRLQRISTRYSHKRDTASPFPIWPVVFPTVFLVVFPVIFLVVSSVSNLPKRL